MVKDEGTLAAADRIKWALIRKRLPPKAPDLAEATGIKMVTARAYLNGGRNPSLEKSLQIGAALECNGFWIFNGDGDRLAAGVLDEINAGKPFPIQATVPNLEDHRLVVYSAALAGPDGEIQLMIERSHQVDAPPELENIPDAYGVRVVGESMEDRFYGGETVFVNPYEPIAKGHYVIVQLFAPGDQGTVYGLVKRFVSFNDNELVLTQLKPAKELRYPRKLVKSVHKIVHAAYR